MTALRDLVSRFRGLARRQQADRDIDDEIAAHLAEAVDDYVGQGLSLEDATRAARRSFGGVTQAKETCREVRSFMWVDDLVRDLSYARRSLSQSRAFTIAATATLSLAIGANTAMFSALDAVLLRPLPYRAADQLAMLFVDDPAQNIREGRRLATSSSGAVRVTALPTWRPSTRSPRR